MVNIAEEFPSKYLKSADLKGSVQRVVINTITVEQIGPDRKLIMYFVGKEKGMVLNKTNARTIGDVFGEDTDEWADKTIEVFSMKVDFQGRMVDGLRVRIPPPKRNGSSPVAPNARARAQSENPAPPPLAAVEELDDDDLSIPF